MIDQRKDEEDLLMLKMVEEVNQLFEDMPFGGFDGVHPARWTKEELEQDWRDMNKPHLVVDNT